MHWFAIKLHFFQTIEAESVFERNLVGFWQNNRNNGGKMEKQEQLLPNPRRTILQMAVAGVLNDVGFAKSDKQCVETLTEVNMKTDFFQLIDF